MREPVKNIYRSFFTQHCNEYCPSASRHAMTHATCRAGTDSGQLADCLGLEASKFHRQDAANRTDHESAFAHQSQEVRILRGLRCSSAVLP